MQGRGTQRAEDEWIFVVLALLVRGKEGKKNALVCPRIQGEGGRKETLRLDTLNAGRKIWISGCREPSVYFHR